MSLQIQELEKVVSKKKKSIWSEVKDFFMIFVLIFGFGWLFINAQLFIILFDNLFHTQVSASDIVLAAPTKQLTISKVVLQEKKEEWDDFLQLKKKLLEEQLNKKLKGLRQQRTDMIYKPTYSSYLKGKLTSYHIKFNTLPPDARVIIPKLGVNVHMVNLTNIPIEKIEKADYDDYLYNGVVKYPYTPDPGQTWNVFIFGHSSYYWWKHNPYGTIFAKLPALRHGDIIIVSWNWKIYKYRIFKKFVLWPRQVQHTYKKYTKGQYLSLMTCYPIWTDRQRMVVVAERVK